MGIGIVNISEEKGVDYLKQGCEGLQHYGVFLNLYKLSEFTHNTEDGMYVCMVNAAQSIENVDIDSAIDSESKRRILGLFDTIYKGGVNIE